MNTRGIITNGGRNKSKTLSDLLLTPNSEQILALTETFLDKNVEDAEITKHLLNYTLFRGDRDTTIGRKCKQGGVLLLTSPDIPSIPIGSFSNGACEAVATIHPTLSLTIVTIYRPPDTTLEEFEALMDFIETSVTTHPSSHLILTGDFNFPKELVSWIESDEGVVPIPTHYRSFNQKMQLQKLLTFTDLYYMHQIINIPTRDGPPENTLDLLFTNTPEMLHSIESVDMIGISDHKLINLGTEFTIAKENETTLPQPKSGISGYNFERANIDNLKTLHHQQRSGQHCKSSKRPN